MVQLVLIVGSQDALFSTLAKAIQQEFDCQTIHVESLSCLQAALTNQDNFFAAVVDQEMAVCQDCEAIFLISKAKIPIVALSNFTDPQRRNQILSSDIRVLLSKGGRVIERVLNSVHHIKNCSISKVLVVDDSRVSRLILKKMLETHNYQVLTASNGDEALEFINCIPDIKLVITDYHMADMDGVSLIAQIRQKYSRNEMAIIGVSSSSENDLTSHFLKVGANDFIYKGCSLDEFHCRVRQNIEFVENFGQLKELSIRDSLTTLYNRHYFFMTCNELFEVYKRSQAPFALAMIDIDYFKKINDDFGHDAGDFVLRKTAFLLKGSQRASDVVARYGGEEFVFFATNINREYVFGFFDRIRQAVFASKTMYGSCPMQVSVSIGVVSHPKSTLKETLIDADKCLYIAKRKGRNRVIHDFDSAISRSEVQSQNL